MEEVSMLDLYDDATNGEEDMYWNVPYMGTRLAARIEGQNKLFMWFVNQTDVERMFDTSEYKGEKQFEDAVEEWVLEHQV